MSKILIQENLEMEESGSNFGKIFLRSCNLRENFDTKEKKELLN